MYIYYAYSIYIQNTLYFLYIHFINYIYIQNIYKIRYIYNYIYMYILYIYISKLQKRCIYSVCVCIYIYIHVYIYILYIYTYMYIYIQGGLGFSRIYVQHRCWDCHEDARVNREQRHIFSDRSENIEHRRRHIRNPKPQTQKP